MDDSVDFSHSLVDEFGKFGVTNPRAAKIVNTHRSITEILCKLHPGNHRDCSTQTMASADNLLYPVVGKDIFSGCQ